MYWRYPGPIEIQPAPVIMFDNSGYQPLFFLDDGSNLSWANWIALEMIRGSVNRPPIGVGEVAPIACGAAVPVVPVVGVVPVVPVAGAVPVVPVAGVVGVGC